jgi:hypothetical protein
MLIDDFLPTYDVSERHWTLVRADAPDAFRAVRELNLSRSLPAMAMFVVRGIPGLLTGKAVLRRRFGLAELTRMGFVPLAEDEPNELVFGLIGRFWRPSGAIERVTSDEFIDYNRPGYAKATMNFHVSPREDSSLVSTETRVQCLDDGARRSFLRYWRFIGPFSGWIRQIMLDDVSRRAEAPSSGS